MAYFTSEIPRTEEVDAELLIERAKDESDCLGRSVVSKTFSSTDGRNFRMVEKKCADLTQEDRERTFQLFEENMKSTYESTWGWKPIERKREIFHIDTRFIYVIEDTQDTPVEEATGKSVPKFAAFTAFRFDWDDEDEPEYPVLFCYELQVDERFRGLNIGAQVMDALIRISYHWRMWKTMLTCFKKNTAAMEFYRKIGFKVDSNSPSSCGYNDEDYEILSFKNKS